MPKSLQIGYKGLSLQHVRVRHLKSEGPPIESVPVVKKLLKVFPADLLGIPPEWEIDFGIDFVSDTRPISIPPYRIDLVELS